MLIKLPIWLIALVTYAIVSELVAIVKTIQLIMYYTNKKYAENKPVLWKSNLIQEILLFSTLVWLPLYIIFIITSIFRD